VELTGLSLPQEFADEDRLLLAGPDGVEVVGGAAGVGE